MKHSNTSWKTNLQIVCVAGILFAAAAIAVLHSVKKSERNEKQAIQSEEAAASEDDWVEKWGDDYVKISLGNLGNTHFDENQVFWRRFWNMKDSNQQHRLSQEFMSRYLAYEIKPSPDADWLTRLEEYFEEGLGFLVGMKEFGFTEKERVDFFFEVLAAYRRNCFAPLPDLKKLDYNAWSDWHWNAVKARRALDRELPGIYTYVFAGIYARDMSEEMKAEAKQRLDEFEEETKVQIANEMRKLGEFFIYWPLVGTNRPYRVYRGKKYDYDDVELTKEIE